MGVRADGWVRTSYEVWLVTAQRRVWHNCLVVNHPRDSRDAPRGSMEGPVDQGYRPPGSRRRVPGPFVVLARGYI